jgi:hypothetical protein
MINELINTSISFLYFVFSMRRIFILNLLFMSIFANAQSLINENFESWIDNSAFIDPEAWVSLNDLNPEYGLPFTVFKSTDSREGNYAALLKSSTFKDFENRNDTIASIMVYGSNVNSGIPYAWVKRLKTISFYYKFQPNGIDTGAMYLTVGYRDKRTNRTINQGGAYYIFGKKQETYTKVTLPIYYSSNYKCDTFVFAFINSIEKVNGNRNKPGTELFIDDIDTEWEVFPPVAVVHEPELEIGIYPNPAFNKIFIKGLSSEGYMYTIINNLGQMVASNSLINHQIDIEKLSPGLYHLSLLSESGFSSKTYFLKK